MKSKHVLTLLTLSLFTIANPRTNAQRSSPDDPLWRFVGPVANVDVRSLTTAAAASGPRSITTKLRAYGRFAASDALIVATLAKAPAEFTSAAPPVMTIPLPDGTFERVKVEESPIFSPELQAQYDYVRTYAVRGVDDSTLTGRLDHTPAGFHAMLISDRGVLFVDPSGDTANEYVSYWKSDATGDPAFCQTHGKDVLPDKEALVDLARSPSDLAVLPLAMNPSGSQLRTYRLALSVTGEYTRFFDGNPPTAGTPNTVAQIATTVNRVTGVFEREIQIRLNLTTTRIFLDPATDPFSSGDFRTENQTTLDANPGTANYDIGHVFSQGGTGGVATLAVVCVGGSKARGFTSRPTPSGDPFDIDFVAHEMGHQLAGNHTWTSNTNSCADAGQFVAGAAFEPGSGSTIMSYAGICSPQDVQANSDAYLHTRNYDEIVAFRTSGAGNGCGTLTGTGNAAPLVDAGSDCTIPRNTPFTLTATGSDPDGDSLTFLWEQFDAGTHGQIPAAGNTTGPMFRSRPATSSQSRTFPRLVDILSGAATPWEVLPNVDRTMNFRVTARDNRTGGGGVDFDSSVVTVSGDPFAFTFPTAGSSLECGGPATVQWTVGGGSIAPNVAIQLSTDDGQNFSPFVASTPNDGSHAMTTPQTLTSQGRMKLVPSAQCFFAISQKFSITDTLNPSITAPADVVQECTSATGTPATLGVATASDQCDATPTITNNAPAVFPLGTSSVLWTATDDSGHQGTDSQLVTIQDTTPPVIASVTATPNSLWPPNHIMVPIAVAVSVADVCDATPSCHIKSVASNEPTNGTGDGNTNVDWVITGPLTLQLRAERAGNKTGRIYTITVECTDGSGNSSTKDVTVVVAHDQGSRLVARGSDWELGTGLPTLVATPAGDQLRRGLAVARVDCRRAEAEELATGNWQLGTSNWLMSLQSHVVLATVLLPLLAQGPMNVRDYLRLDGTQLDLRGTVVRDEDLRDLSATEFSRVTAALLSGTQVGDAGVAYLARLPLRQLDLGRTQITDGGLAHLQRLPLERLDLTGTNVTDAGLANLKGLPLAMIVLRDTKITGMGLSALKGLDLRVLDVSHTAVGDAGIHALESVRRIATLDVSDTQITDGAVPSLERLTGLSTLNLSGTTIGPDGVARLKRSRPQLNVLTARPVR